MWGQSKQVLLAIICSCALMAASLGSSGCAYMSRRGNDALDILDVGVSTSSEPRFALYIGFLNVLSVGYSNVDGTLVGLGGRHAGLVPMRQNAGGVLLWGYEQLGYEEFDPADPASPPSWRVGVIGLAKGPAPPKEQVVNCPKLLHLGWVGLTLNCRLGELADFLLGWTTVDIMGDDAG
ncbi:MAG: hypothetical protein R6V05_01290 [Candidatus Brocadiia bacterium]